MARPLNTSAFIGSNLPAPRHYFRFDSHTTAIAARTQIHICILCRKTLLNSGATPGFQSRHAPQFHKTSKLAIRANGIAMMPILKNSQAVISTFSRRRAMSQRIVASEPVTERLGPRSTPIKIACATTLVSSACRIAAPLIRPMGKIIHSIRE